MRRWGTLIISICAGLLAAGCPKGGGQFSQGQKAETLQDYDAAYAYYQKAVKAEPYNATYKIKLNQARFEAGQSHIKKGLELRKKGDLAALQLAAGEFQRALSIDPASSVAEQELNKTVEMIADKNRQNEAATQPPGESNEPPLASMPPQLKPLSRGPINMKMSNDAKIVFDTIGKWAGITMIYDPDFPARRITVDLNNVTLEQALEIASLQSKAFWKPVTDNVIFVIPDQPQKRKDYEEEVVRTFYLSNTVTPQDLTEIVTGLRQLLDLRRIQPLNSQNAIILRDTPDKLLLAEKMIRDIDKAKPEVVVQVEVLEVSSQRIRELGITPGQSASVTFSPGTSTTSGGSTTTTTPLTLNNLKHLSTKDYSVTLPSASVTAALNDTATKILQNPEIRSVDGQIAHLKIGQRIPVATGSFQAGVGVGATGGAGFVNPLVNTQFTYLDVGVNVDVTPRVHPDREVSLKLMIEISSQLGSVNIGGITQPIISSRKIEHDIRLKEGEVNILGGLFQRTETQTLTGWPGLGKLPIFGRLFSDNKTEHDEDEVLLVLTPHIVRMPGWTKANLQPLFSGTETNVQVKQASELRSPQMEQAPANPSAQQQPANTNPATAVPAPAAGAPANMPSQPADAATSSAKIRFEPQSVSLKTGQTATLGLVVENVNDLFSIPLLLQYNPAVISVEDVQYGGFLSGGTQEIAIVKESLKDRGQEIISATRQPNTPGVSGSGTLMGIVVKALAPGSTNLSIVQVNAKDSQQRKIVLVTSEATLQVQP